MSLTFPRYPGAGARGAPVPPGQPARASHCRCGPQQILDEDGGCERCGHYTKDTIAETWNERAQRIALQRAKRQGR